jgi:D-tyrosyl-tRNA(Tyr) deacylase
LARSLYERFVALARAQHPLVQTGRFATEMKVHLVNDGPITIPLRMVA